MNKINDHYKDLREKANAEQDQIYHKALNPDTQIGSNESMPCIKKRPTNPAKLFCELCI